MEAANAGIRVMKGIHRALGLLDNEALKAAQQAQDAMAAQRIVYKALYAAFGDESGNPRKTKNGTKNHVTGRS